MAKYAYAMRYGHQPLSELRAMRRGDLDMLIDELCDIVRAENGTPKDAPDAEPDTK